MHSFQPKKQANPGNSEAIIELHKVEKTYQSDAGSYRALKTIDLEIKRGEFVGIIGRSGSGNG